MSKTAPAEGEIPTYFDAVREEDPLTAITSFVRMPLDALYVGSSCITGR